jgi:aminoglycoside 6'-N-acetyltransferase
LKTNHNISFRTATINDLELLEHWDKQQHVIDSDPDDDWDWRNELKRFPNWREQLIAEIDGRPLGFVQIIDPNLEDSHYWGEVDKNLRAIDIWIGDKEDLGKGYGTIMMNLAIERCYQDKNVTAILIDPLESNKGAIRFYKRLGFNFLEKRVFDKSHCVVLKLNRKNWELIKR